MACDPRCLSHFSDDPVNAHDCRDSQGRSRRHDPDDPVAEGRRDNAATRAHRATSRRQNRNR